MKTKVITLCGSTRFKREYRFWNIVFTLSGYVVLSCAFMGHAEKVDVDSSTKGILDKAHIKKIAMSNRVFIIDPDEYIGESTAREIFFAEAMDIPTYRLSHYKKPYIGSEVWWSMDAYRKAITIQEKIDGTIKI